MIPGFHPIDLLGILVVALLIFGPKKLPEMGAAIGKSITSFKKGIKEATDDKDAEETLSLVHQEGGSCILIRGDLGNSAFCKKVVDKTLEKYGRIDVLINNAGAMFGSRQLTEDGLELTFALNHMSYFVMTQGLLKSLQAAAPAQQLALQYGFRPANNAVSLKTTTQNNPFPAAASAGVQQDVPGAVAPPSPEVLDALGQFWEQQIRR